MENDDVASEFTKLWLRETIDSPKIRNYFIGRLIPLNKVFPMTPLPHQMRPIVTLSPLVKIFETRFKKKLHRYLTIKMIPC